MTAIREADAEATLIRDAVTVHEAAATIDRVAGVFSVTLGTNTQTKYACAEIVADAADREVTIS